MSHRIGDVPPGDVACTAEDARLAREKQGRANKRAKAHGAKVPSHAVSDSAVIQLSDGSRIVIEKRSSGFDILVFAADGSQVNWSGVRLTQNAIAHIRTSIEWAQLEDGSVP